MPTASPFFPPSSTLCLMIGQSAIFWVLFFGQASRIMAQVPLPLLEDENESSLEQIEDERRDSVNFTVIPVGILVGDRNVVQSALVKGQEDGLEAINFPQWRVPFDVVVTALQLRVEPLANGELEVRSPGLVRRLNPDEFVEDAELGTVLTIAQIETLFNVTAEFDINEFAIRFNVPWFGIRDRQGRAVAAPVILEGLPYIHPPTAELAAVQQRLNIDGSNQPNRGELAAIGTLAGGSLYTRLNQGDVFNPQTWRLNDLQYARQGEDTDIFLGTQPQFWQHQQQGDYWGATWISRQGFTPPLNVFGSVNPLQRLQADQIGQTISGQAEPGTLVRLVQGFGNRVIDEILVDSSGIYHFEDVIFEGQLGLSNYRVLLYPNGQLTATPEIRDATFSAVPGQLPQGTSAFIASAGVQRQLSQGGFIGEFTGIQGGIAQRWGVSEELTLGVGAIYDAQVRGLANIFWQPRAFPLRMAVSALTTAEEFPLEVISDISFTPSRNLRANFNSDRLSSRLNVDWQVLPQLSFSTTWGSRDSLSLGTRFNLSHRDFFLFGNASINLDNQFRWNLSSRYQQLQLSAFGNELGVRSELTYHFSPNFYVGQSLLLSYDARSNNDFVALSWRYRSPELNIDGSPRWETQLGYGIGTQGSGILAAAQTSILPGIALRARYEGISATTNASTFNLELVSSLNVQRGITGIGQRRFDYLRTQSGLMVQPEISGETLADSFPPDPNLLILNNQPIPASRVQISGNRILVNLPPGIYRLDLDPAGYPLNYQPTTTAFAVEVTPGAYTPVIVPFSPSYVVTGLVLNSQGEAVVGARVEAIATEGQERVFSITNAAGVYYLEGLSQQTYRLQINGQPAEPNLLILEADSEPFQEINLETFN